MGPASAKKVLESIHPAVHFSHKFDHMIEVTRGIEIISLVIHDITSEVQCILPVKHTNPVITENRCILVYIIRRAILKYLVSVAAPSEMRYGYLKNHPECKEVGMLPFKQTMRHVKAVGLSPGVIRLNI